MIRHNLFSVVFTYFLTNLQSFLPSRVCLPEPFFLHLESTSETLEHSSEDANKTSLSSSPNTRSTETNNIDMSTLAYNMYNTAVKNKSETDHSASKIIFNTTTLNSYTRSHTSTTGMCI